MYARLIINPAAGAGKTARRWPKLLRFLKSIGLRFEHDFTEAPGHATELAHAAIKQGYPMIVSVGGDGTINEVVNGMQQEANDAVLGIISTGTGSDYARSINLKPEREQSCSYLLEPKKTKMDIGSVRFSKNGTQQERFFVNFAGIGFAAEVTRQTNEKFKPLGSTLSYLMGLLTSFCTFHSQELSVTLDDKVETNRILTIMLNNGRYGGGKMLIAPDADMHDGMLDVMIVEHMNKLDLLTSLPRIYRGSHLSHPKITMRHARRITVSCEHTFPVQADGEVLGETPAIITVLPGALTLAT